MLPASIWQSLLTLADKIKAFPGNIGQIRWYEDASKTRLLGSGSDFTMGITVECHMSIGHYTFYFRKGTMTFAGENLDESGKWLKLYLQIVLAKQEAKRLQRSITIAHFAQTIDGKIATVQNDSKWIGNEANLVHAHRMRALCDGVLVGKSTFEIDDPSLTVRHVDGPDPKKVIIGTVSPSLMEQLKNRTDEIILVTNEHYDFSKQVKSISVHADAEGIIQCSKVLSKLFSFGIYTLYIEGGAITTSQFIRAGCLDYLQVHISPIIFGSGIDAFVLPKIFKVDEAIRYKDYDLYMIGGAPMFAGVLSNLVKT